MRLFSRFLTLAALLAALPAVAQLRLPSLPQLPQSPLLQGPVVRPLLQALPDLRNDLPLLELRQTAVRNLLRQHGDLIEPDPLGAPVRRGELLLVAPAAALLAAAQTQGFTVLRDSTLAELDLREVTLRAPPGVGTAEALARLRALDPAVEADFNHLYTPGGEVTGAAATPSAAGSAAPRVGLIDGGVDRHHRALRNAGGADWGCDGKPVPSEHGTAVASLLVGRDSSFSGGLPRAELFAADVYCNQPAGGSAEAVAQALAWLARERVGVINLSLVGPPNRLLERAVLAVTQRGHLVVAAVGNDGPAAPPLFPASYAGVVGVTGVTPQRRAMPEAAQGEQVLLAAPGTEMAVARLGGGYASARGTSFAAPLAAALLAAELPRPDATAAAAALRKLTRSALDLGAPGRDPVYGWGLVAEDLRAEPERLRGR